MRHCGKCGKYNPLIAEGYFLDERETKGWSWGHLKVEGEEREQANSCRFLTEHRRYILGTDITRPPGYISLLILDRTSESLSAQPTRQPQPTNPAEWPLADKTYLPSLF